jgi:arginine decarboxylase
MSSPARKRPLASVGRARAREQYEESAVLYGIPNWGKGYFRVNEDGDLVVHPTLEPSRFVVLKQIVDEVALRGITAPMVLRFPQILASAVASLNDAFAHAIEEYGYENTFRGVFPIKVNQKRVVVQKIIEAGRQYGYGLEAGSKPSFGPLRPTLGPIPHHP